MPLKTLGAQSMMGSLTVTRTMLARAVLVGNAPSAILLFETSFAIGPIERGYSLRKRRQACSSLNDLKNNALLDDGQLTCLCHRTLALLLRLTSEMYRSHGVQFTPLVAETTAAWEPHSASFLKWVARAVAAREGASAALLEAQLLQELCIAARSFHARTVLHRRAELSAATSWSVADRCWCWSSELRSRGGHIHQQWNCCCTKQRSSRSWPQVPPCSTSGASTSSTMRGSALATFVAEMVM